MVILRKVSLYLNLHDNNDNIVVTPVLTLTYFNTLFFYTT